jgi:hypothetical protein
VNETGSAFAQFYPRVFPIEDEFRGRRILHEERLAMLQYIIRLIKVIHSDRDPRHSLILNSEVIRPEKYDIADASNSITKN